MVQRVGWRFGDLQGIKGDIKGYRGLQGVTRGYKGLQGIARGYSGLQGVTRDYMGLQGVTRDDFRHKGRLGVGQQTLHHFKEIKRNMMFSIGMQNVTNF